jgi:hypothetical protein
MFGKVEMFRKGEKFGKRRDVRENQYLWEKGKCLPIIEMN